MLDLKQHLVSSLSAYTVTGCSDWAQKYRVIKSRRYNFRRHPWCRAMHDSETPHNVGMKASQVGFTETVLNRTFYMIDVRKVDCLYVLPSKIPDAIDFSSGRFDPALEESEHLQNLFSDVKNTGHKRAGAVSLYVRGSRSRGGLKSIPVGFLVLDERAEMLQENVNLALERLSGQENKQIWEISTPTVPNKNIDLSFQTSTQQHYFFPCPHCSRRIELVYPDSVLIEERAYRCTACKHIITAAEKLAALQKGEWVAAKPKAEKTGWYLPQMYSNTITAEEFVADAVAAENDPLKDQEFHNSKLGQAYVAEGAKLNESNISYYAGREAAGNREAVADGTFNTMGIDVGSFLNIIVVNWQLPNSFCPDINTNARGKIICAEKTHDFEALRKYMYDYQVHAAVIDSQPERRKAKEFADEFMGFVKLCYYAQGGHGRSITVKDDDDHLVLVDRTTWFDLLSNNIRKGRFTFPVAGGEELVTHVTNLVKIYRSDKNGNPTAYYDSTGPDHYAHALNYAQIALPLAANLQTGRDIGSFL